MSDGRLNHVRNTKTITRWYLRHQSVDTGADRIEKLEEAYFVAFAPSFGPTIDEASSVTALSELSRLRIGEGFALEGTAVGLTRIQHAPTICLSSIS